MPTYREFREVLRKAGFELKRMGKHEIWQRVEPDSWERQVPVSH